jgi:hypothetical protein
MNTLTRAFVGCTLLSMPVSGYAYKQLVHQIVSRYAAENSILNESENGPLYSLGLGDNVHDKRFLLPSTLPFTWTLTPARLIEYGAHEEDEGFATVGLMINHKSFNHFLDPQQRGQALTVIPPLISYPSDRWALEPEAIGIQDFSYSDAKHHLKIALTAPSRSVRDRSLGRLFETIGHVIHHLQDMAQPQHVRDDDHCDRLLCGPVYRPSGYEEYTYRNRNLFDLGGYMVPDYAAYRLPINFWTHDGIGIAEFVSNNFVSARTNFRGTLDEMRADGNHPRPEPPGRVGVNAENIEDLLGPVGPKQPLHGTIWFVKTPIVDEYVSSGSGENRRTSSFSLFESDIRGNPNAFGVYPVFSLNRFNYDAAAGFLLPRAAAYSIGLINYFFRGRIEIEPPDSGVYAVVDHAATNLANDSFRDGFRKIKVKLRNATKPGVSPDGSNVVHQEMPNGTLKAIAKYMVNPCYQPDLLGEYDGSPISSNNVITRNGCTLLQYLVGVEEISVSQERVDQSLNRDAAKEFVFDFSDRPIPINARDLSIQIVYEGELGDEPDAIVVSGRNISEPTYISLINGSDYFGIDSTLYTPEEIRGRPDLLDRVAGANFDSEPLENVRFLIGGVPVTDAGSLPTKEHHRIAVLADAEFRPPATGPAMIRVEVQSAFSDEGLSRFEFELPPIRNQLERAPRTLSRIDAARRGLTAWYSLYRFKVLAGSSISAEEVDSKPPMDPDCLVGGKLVCVPSPTPISIIDP